MESKRKGAIMKSNILGIILAAFIVPAVGLAATGPLASKNILQNRSAAMAQSNVGSTKPITFVVNFQLDKMPQGATVVAVCGVGVTATNELYASGTKEVTASVGADGKWTGSVNVVVAVPLDKLNTMKDWYCGGGGYAPNLQAPTWSMTWGEQMLVGKF